MTSSDNRVARFIFCFFLYVCLLLGRWKETFGVCLANATYSSLSPSLNPLMHTFGGVSRIMYVSLVMHDCSGGEDRFEVDSESGIIRTRGAQPFRGGKEYEIGVSAQDISAKTMQKSPTHSLKILVGERDPQFYETQYVANVPESASEQYK